ncbi:hypothetical protein WJX84_004830 [Apatococcus fuscideae]|uniref:Transmembrane protein 65 n=1 Tax=Apatococcus fuscideae TaxID=2026836 RepID=A0AAW1T9H9_9CHLO
MTTLGFRGLQYSRVFQRACSSITGSELRAVVLDDPEAAGKALRASLNADQQALFHRAFTAPGGSTHQLNDASASSKAVPGRAALFTVAVASCVPFIGFGFLDNFIMIIAGEQIEASVGVRFALSTMAAAGLGNIVSDIAGLGFADVIEAQARKLSWCREPPLSNIQKSMYSTRACKVGGSVVGITVGGLLGLLPLLWIPNPSASPVAVQPVVEE